MQIGGLPVIDLSFQVFSIMWAVAMTLPYSSYILTIRYTTFPQIYDSLFSSDIKCMGTCLIVGTSGTILSALINISNSMIFLALTILFSIFVVGTVRMSQSLRK